MDKYNKKRLKLYAAALSMIVIVSGCNMNKNDKNDNQSSYEPDLSTDFSQEETHKENIVSSELETSISSEMESSSSSEIEENLELNESPDIVLKEKADEALTALSEDLDRGLVLAKETFILFVDFIFYDGVIAGKTFDELSDAVKADVINSFTEFDIAVEKYIPGYKETISEYSEVVKEFFKSIPGYLEEEWDEFKGSLDSLYQRFKGE